MTSPPCSVPWYGLISATTRPSSVGRGCRNWTSAVPCHCGDGRGAAGAGGVAVGAVEQREPAAVRVHRIQVYRAAARVLPAAEHDAPVVEDVGVEVVALVERNLADAGAVRVHHVKHESVLVLVLVLGGELRLALVDQHRLRLALARRGKDDAPVRQVVGRDVVAFLGDDVGGDHAPQHVGGAVVLPDVPGRLLAVHGAGDQRHAHREHDLRAVVRAVDVARVPEAAGDALGNVDFRHVGRRAVAQPHVRAGGESLELAHVDVVELGQVDGQGAAHVRDRDVEHDRIRRLAAADVDVAVVPCGTAGERNGRKRQNPRCRIRDGHLNSLRSVQALLHDRMQARDCVTDHRNQLVSPEYKHLHVDRQVTHRAYLDLGRG